jgi:aldose 1-epimerase
MAIREFGRMGDETILEISLENEAGSQARVLTYGSVLRDLVISRPGGEMQRVVLGLETLEHYLQHSPSFGANVGRYGNRIGHGRFMLDGKTYQTPLNQQNKHSLHGGGPGYGFSERPWKLLAHDQGSVTLGLVSPDGDAGYPGTLTTTCRYRLAEPSTLRVEFTAFTDQATVLNLAHHSYFNLDGSADILDHDLAIRANMLTPVDADLIPDGSIAPVAGTAYDFRLPRPIRRMAEDGSRVWYDHNYILRRERREPPVGGIELAHAATLSSAKSGISMEIWTSEPCLQIYDGAKLKVAAPGLDGVHYGPNAGFALEPQHAPDSPNLPHLPSTVLRPGELYRQVSEFRFGSLI